MAHIVWTVALGVRIAVLASLIDHGARRKLTAMSDTDLDRAMREAADWAEPNSLAGAEMKARQTARNRTAAAKGGREAADTR